MEQTLNLNSILSQLRYNLISKHSFEPETSPLLKDKSTYQIDQFAKWLDQNPEAVQELKNLGILYKSRIPAHV